MLATRFALVLAAALAAGAAPAAAEVRLPADFVNQTVVSGLSQPTSMAFLPDGRVLVTEQRTGEVRLIVNGGFAATDPVLTVPGLVARMLEEGLQGVAVDPRWPAEPHVYLYYNRFGNRCRLVRYTASGDLDDAAGDSLVLADPLLLIDDIPDDDPNHQAGCLRFGPDGHLYVSLGEDEDVCAAADSTTLKGQVLRLDVSRLPPGPGGPVPRALLAPADNPLSTPDSNARLVWAYGLRNPWRYQIDPDTGLLYLADVGERDFEELNEVHPGDYLGWPYREGFLVMPRPECPEPGGPGSSAFRPPIVAMGRGSELTAIGSGGIYRPVAGAAFNWPAAHHGDVFWTEYFKGFLRRLERTDGTWGPAPPAPGQPDAVNWGTGLFSAVDFLVGPDGSLWWLRQFDDARNPSSGSLERIRYTGPPTSVPAGVRAGTLAARPNPFRAAVEISFRLGAPGRASLAVYDVSGRLVRRLVDRQAAAGEILAAWDGREASGRAAPPGLYLARLERPGGAETLRLLRLR